MRNLMNLLRCLLAGVTVTGGCLHAQPNVCWVINSAFFTSFTPEARLPVCSPDLAVAAPGSLITLMGTGLGPPAAENAEGFPLRTKVGGTSARLITGGVTIELPVLSAQQNVVQAMLPSRTPIGDGVLVASVDNVPSAPYRIRVVQREFHAFRRGPLSRAENLSADGVSQPNDFTTPVRPGQSLVLYGTGLGAVDGDEIAGPIRSATSGDGVEVSLGLKSARVSYAGRSDCCAGTDQITVETPLRIEGCTVPLLVRFSPEGPVADFGNVAIAERGGCSDSNSMSKPVRRRVAAGSGGRIGSISLGLDGWNGDGLHASFTRFGNHFAIPPGTCGYPPSTYLPGPNGNNYWDAGPGIELSGASAGPVVAVPDEDHNDALGSFYGRSFTASDLEAGSYTISNGQGGANVGPFQIKFTVAPPVLQWTNRGDLSSIQPGQDLTINWITTAADDEYVAISGTFLSFTSDPNGYGYGGFTCLERAEKGTFTVPGWLAWRAESVNAQVLDLELEHFRRQEFTAPGLDFGDFQQKLKFEAQRARIASR
jgi:uncharacterized protein (TIGR03437 family)